MKKIILEITGKSGKSFDLTLNDTNWIGIGGNWNCLPGYMPATAGHMAYDSNYELLYLWDRDRTFGENLSYGFGETGTRPPNKLYGSLDGFKDKPAAGQSGKGNIFTHGASAKSVLTDFLGIVCGDIAWKIKSVV